MASTNAAATAASTSRATVKAGLAGTRALYGPWLGTQVQTLNNYPRSVGLPIVGNPTAFFQQITGSRLGRGAPTVAAASPGSTVGSLINRARQVIGV